MVGSFLLTLLFSVFCLEGMEGMEGLLGEAGKGEAVAILGRAEPDGTSFGLRRLTV